MSNILKRSLAPVTEEAWNEIDAQARQILAGNLSGRRIVDVSGPHGWECAAVNLGTVTAAKSEALKGVTWGVRDVLPLVEIRVPFTLGIWDLDNINRGSKTPELDAVVTAAQRAALFEENAVYHGFSGGGISGLLKASSNKAVTFAPSAATFAGVVESAVHTIQSRGIGGPYDLVLGDDPYQVLSIGSAEGYPLKQKVLAILDGGSILWSPAIDGGAVVSRRGGDYELVIGQDFSIGYHSHDARNVSLYITESVAFRVLEPNAAVELKLKKQ